MHTRFGCSHCSSVVMQSSYICTSCESSKKLTLMTRHCDGIQLVVAEHKKYTCTPLRQFYGSIDLCPGRERRERPCRTSTPAAISGISMKMCYAGNVLASFPAMKAGRGRKEIGVYKVWWKPVVEAAEQRKSFLSVPTKNHQGTSHTHLVLHALHFAKEGEQRHIW